MNEVKRPVGLDAVCDEIEAVCCNKHIYSRGGLRPKHLIINLDSGCGRTTLMQYIADRYKSEGIMNFSGSLDDYIEVSIDEATMNSLRSGFERIDSSAVYANDYGNIVAMDISLIADHLSEQQLTAEFIKECKRVSKNALIVFFVHSLPSRSEMKLISRLTESIDNIKQFEVAPYTVKNIASMVVSMAEERGMDVKATASFMSTLEEVVSEWNALSVEGAGRITDMLIRFANYSALNPVIDRKSLRLMIDNVHIAKEEKANEK